MCHYDPICVVLSLSFVQYVFTDDTQLNNFPFEQAMILGGLERFFQNLCCSDQHSPLSLLSRRNGISKHGHTSAGLQSNGNLPARMQQNKWSEERLVYNDFSNNPWGSKQRSWTKEAVSEDEGGFGILGDLEKISKELPKL